VAPAVALSVALLAWSAVANLRLGDRGYLLRNLVATAALVAVTAIAGPRLDRLGLSPGAVGAGLRWGGGAVAAVVLVLLAGVGLAPRVRPVAALLADARADLPPRAVAYHVLLRIPVGTSTFEEVAFRGVLLGALLAVVPAPAAVVWSSVVFGLWHVPPTIVSLRANDRPTRGAGAVGVVASAVVATSAAGVLFAGLRLVSGSLLAPVLAHWATNAGGMLAARSTRRR
jgi:membrane protease YdiL (CAAX protease family)